MLNFALICGGVSANIEYMNLNLLASCLHWFSIIFTALFHAYFTFSVLVLSSSAFSFSSIVSNNIRQ